MRVFVAQWVTEDDLSAMNEEPGGVPAGEVLHLPTVVGRTEEEALIRATTDFATEMTEAYECAVEPIDIAQPLSVDRCNGMADFEFAVHFKDGDHAAVWISVRSFDLRPSAPAPAEDRFRRRESD